MIAEDELGVWLLQKPAEYFYSAVTVAVDHISQYIKPIAWAEARFLQEFFQLCKFQTVQVGCDIYGHASSPYLYDCFLRLTVDVLI